MMKSTSNNTYSQINIQVVFAVKHREALIGSSWDRRLYQYMTSILQNKGQVPMAINGTHDHVHILFGMKPTCCLSDLVRELKKSTNEFINTQRLCAFRFAWQEGYGAFSYSRWDITKIVRYINNQKAHHATQNFREEYLKFLNEFEIDYKEEYLYNWIDD